MELHNMKPTPGSRHSKLRVGRGDKTARRGENGQKSRAGYSAKIGFEGGQNPLYRRLPKRGFSNYPHKKIYTIVNIEDLAKIDSKDITPEIMIEAGLIKNNYGLLKVLGNGEIKNPVKVTAHKFSKSAEEAITKAGGSIVLLESTEEVVEASNEAKPKANKKATPEVEKEPTVDEAKAEEVIEETKEDIKETEA